MEKTNDRDYEVEERYAHTYQHAGTAKWSTRLIDGMYRRYRSMEAAANKLQKEAKGYLDSLRGSQFLFRARYGFVFKG